MQVTNEHVNRINELYISFRGRYVMSADGQTFVPKWGNGYAKLTDAVVWEHLNYRRAVGVYAGPYTSRFICFDIDDGSPDVVRSVVNSIEATGVPSDKIYVSLSGKKGYHVEIFFDHLMQTSLLKRFYRFVCSDAQQEPSKVEFRPTKSQAIKLPLGKHPATGNICWFVDRDTLEPIESPDYLFEIVQMSGDTMCEIINALPRPERDQTTRADHKPAPSDTADGLPDLAETGTTHNTIVKIAVRLAYEDVKEEDIVASLASWLKRQNPTFLTDPIHEIEKDIRAVAAWASKEGFRKKRPDTIGFTAEEVAELLKKRPRICRRTLFALMYETKLRGGRSASIAEERLAKEIGCTRQAVANAIERFVGEGLIGVKQHIRYKMGNTYRGVPARYTWCGNGGAAVITVAPTGINSTWAAVMMAAVPDMAQLKKMLGPKELEELNHGIVEQHHSGQDGLPKCG